MSMTRIPVDNMNIAAEVFLLEAHAPVAGQYVGYIDNDIFCLVSVGEGVLIETSPLRPSQLNSDAGAQERLVVSYLSNLLMHQ